MGAYILRCPSAQHAAMRGWSKSSSEAGTRSRMGRVACLKVDVSLQCDMEEAVLWLLVQNCMEPSKEAMARVDEPKRGGVQASLDGG